MKEVFIINPTTHREKLYRLMENIKKNKKGKQVIIEKTKSSKHAEFIAQKYAMFETEPTHLYVCGGDGLLHETINGVVNARNEVYVSVLPLGTGNDFVKYFEDVTLSDFMDLKNYEEENILDCDVLSVNGEYVINTVSFGFDVHVAKYANSIKKKIPVKGIVPYYMGMLATLFKPIGNEYRIQVDDKRLPKDNYSFIVFCNGKYYGGGYKPCPKSCLNDGIIDMCFIKDVSRPQILELASEYKEGTHIVHTDLVTLKQGKIAHIDTNNEPIYGNLDGEVIEFKNPTIEVVEKAIHLWLPKVGD